MPLTYPYFKVDMKTLYTDTDTIHSVDAPLLLRTQGVLGNLTEKN